MIDYDWVVEPWDYRSRYMAATARTEIAVTDATTQARVSGAIVKAWRVSTYDQQVWLLADEETDSSGQIVFDWSCGPGCVWNDLPLLVKVWANGYAPAVQWFSIFDAFEQRAILGWDTIRVDFALTRDLRGQ